MPHHQIQLRRALPIVLLGVLLGLAACSPTATVNVVATTPPSQPTRTPIPTPPLAPTPTNVPAGWKVLATQHFSLAYPPDWTITPVADSGSTRYFLKPPPPAQSQVIVEAQPQGEVTPYCPSAGSGAAHVTFASLPMTYWITGAGNDLRQWAFADAQHTVYVLSADDAHFDAATQAQDTAILATFRPEIVVPWHCP